MKTITIESESVNRIEEELANIRGLGIELLDNESLDDAYKLKVVSALSEALNNISIELIDIEYKE